MIKKSLGRCKNIACFHFIREIYCQQKKQIEDVQVYEDGDKKCLGVNVFGISVWCMSEWFV